MFPLVFPNSVPFDVFCGDFFSGNIRFPLFRTMVMKKILIAILACVSICVVPVFAAPKKSSAGAETSPVVWAKKAKTFNQKQVYTYVEEIGASGYVTAEAPFGVIPVKTATEQGKSNGRILVLVSFAAFEKFGAAYAPKYEKGGSSFGKKAQLKKLAGIFTMHKKEPVLLVGLPIEVLKDAPAASKMLEKQLADEAQETGADKSSREGFTKKVFRVGSIGKDSKLKSEFKRLVGLYNKGKKSAEKYKPEQMTTQLEEGDGEEFFTAFDEAKKIEWEIRY